MDLWQLHIFVSVVENKSFSKASEAVHLSQPTVSSHIKELEDHFQCRLLDRLGKTTEPTRAGELLFKHAKKLLALRDQTESTMHDFLGRQKGSLHIGGSSIPAAFIIPRLLGPFAGLYPGVDLQMIAKDTMQIIQDIRSGKLEVGIVGANVDDPNLVQKKIIQDEMKLIVPKEHRWFKRSYISFSDLVEEPMIAREKGSGTWVSVTKSMEENGFNPKELNIRITIDNTISVIHGILNQLGVSILSTIAVKNEIEAGRLAAVSIKGLNLNRFFYLTYSSKRDQSPLCAKFIEHTLSFF